MDNYQSFDIISYFEEAEISFSYSGKNISNNWIGTNCPFCDDTSNHLGINLDSKIYSCFRCGSKGGIPKLIKILENKTFGQIIPILKQFTKKNKNYSEEIGITRNVNTQEFFYSISEKLTQNHKEYLSSRNFDPDFLEATYKLRSGKITSSYKHRIIIPYLIKGKIYTFSARDVSGQAKMKYMHCPIEQSIKSPKDILYNVDNCKDVCLGLEGTFDTFRIGRGSVSLSGIQYTANQLLILSKFKQVFLLFDPEEKAQEMALQLGKDLSFCSSSIDIIQIKIDCDPGDMKDEDVKHLKRELFGRNT